MRIATDIGGTFTDLVYVDNEGQLGVEKSHTTPPEFEQGILDVMKKANVKLEEVGTLIHGTTVVINALTERKGVKTGLITTKGFRDVLEIGRGNRPDLFNLKYKKPEPFVPRRYRQEISARINAAGESLQSLDKKEIDDIMEFFLEEKVEAIAVCYLHSYINPQHEIDTMEYIKREWPSVSVTASHQITQEWREYERTSTTVLNSYINPIASSYINRLADKFGKANENVEKYIMQSNGGVNTFEQAKETPINLVESGPVAGIYGAAMLGKLIGEENIISLDIGGTTAKCSLIDQGEVKVDTDYKIEATDKFAGYPIKVPVVDIVEIGNGGGSIAWIDNGALKVGPQSAGAKPGPIAYDLGGDVPTTTDANILTGRLSLKNFDHQGDIEKIRKITEDKIAKHFDMSSLDAALGIIRIANSNMLNALKLISVRKGYDPSEFSIVASGGGGPMHATALAKELGVKKVIVPVAASVFSAWGMLMTDLRSDYIKTHIVRLDEIDPKVITEVNNEWELLGKEAIERLSEKGFKDNSTVLSCYLDMRYSGQEHTVKVPIPRKNLDFEDVENIITKFHELHEQQFTFKLLDTPTEIVNFHLISLGKVDKPEIKKLNKKDYSVEEAIVEKRNVYFEDEGLLKTKIYDRELLGPTHTIQGPAIIEEQTTSTLLYPDQSLEMDDYGNLIIHNENKVKTEG
ncbi:hydantoinase/oxoprolinase family protein [Salinicoccus roseus]|uniref:hydantoinase/oxoprolinase family protein n=1 Tax=Salinicoccus roseus TaxID=45670 RepID=UPI00352479D3